jgi:hypothetical protein
MCARVAKLDMKSNDGIAAETCGAIRNRTRDVIEVGVVAGGNRLEDRDVVVRTLRRRARHVDLDVAMLDHRRLAHEDLMHFNRPAATQK